MVNVNKILNVAKTEVICKIKHKTYDTEMRLQFCRNILNRTNYVRYLGKKNNENLDWKIHIHDLASKLSRANSVLFKLRHFVNSGILRTVYFAIF